MLIINVRLRSSPAKRSKCLRGLKIVTIILKLLYDFCFVLWLIKFAKKCQLKMRTLENARSIPLKTKQITKTPKLTYVLLKC